MKIYSLYCFIFGNLFGRFFYSKKYFSGRYFNGRFFGINSLGWKWIHQDVISRILFKKNNGVPFPISPFNSIVNAKNIIFDLNDINNFQGSGKYFQAIGNSKIYIGTGTLIANNVGIITTNHDHKNPKNHLKGEDVKIGKNCWIGMNAMILPGVFLGDNTIVGAGAVVTKSFIEGNCVIAGNPAKIIKKY